MKFFGQLKSFAAWQIYSAIGSNPSNLAARFRSRLLKTQCKIDACVFIENYKNFSCGDGSALYFGTHILNPQGHFELGSRSHLGAYCHANVCHGRIQIGDYVAIGPHCSLIAYSNDYAAGMLVTELRRQEDIHIGNNVFLGANCIVLPGTTIEDNVVVGAGSVIKGRLQSDSVFVGAPCRKIKSITESPTNTD